MDNLSKAIIHGVVNCGYCTGTGRNEQGECSRCDGTGKMDKIETTEGNCKSCKLYNSKLYYGFCQDCLQIDYPCGCQATWDKKGGWYVSYACEEHDITSANYCGVLDKG